MLFLPYVMCIQSNFQRCVINLKKFGSQTETTKSSPQNGVYKIGSLLYNPNIPNNYTNLRLGHLNVRDLERNFDGMKLALHKSQYHFFGVTETKMNKFSPTGLCEYHPTTALRST